ncbi:MAG: DUF3108 domain-containing protein [Deltaproteobacteria bacterium]|nr:DUF3108 domain-containing protein [Deltaproteobacteria bacterium]
MGSGQVRVKYCSLGGRVVLLALAFYLVPCGGFAAPPPAVQPAPSRPQRSFDPPDHAEKTVYHASWNGIPVASATIEAAPVVVEGKQLYRVQVRAASWKYLDLIWKMRDTIESIFDHKTLNPRRFVFRQRENSKTINTTANFDPGSNKWVVHRQQGRKVREYEFVSANTLDPILATYLARSLDFVVGDTVVLEVFGGKSRYQVSLDVVGRERISLKSGDFDAYRIVPRIRNLNRTGYAGRVREATVWISADKWRRPLRMVTQVFIGNVNIEMVEGRS